MPLINSVFEQHGGSVDHTVASQQEGPGLNSWAFLFGVCIFSLGFLRVLLDLYSVTVPQLELVPGRHALVAHSSI